MGCAVAVGSDLQGLNLEVGFAETGESERRIWQEDAGVECAGVGLAEGGEVYRPLEARL